MPAKKTEQRPPAEQFGIRLREPERSFLLEAAKKLSEQSPTRVGLGPYLLWAGRREAEKLLGMTFADYEAREAKRGKSGGR